MVEKKRQKAQSVIRVGQGIDIHPMVTGRHLVLGGVTIPYHRGLKGHSDADVLLHAVMDALLGAAGLGDIGDLFPSSDPKWRGVESTKLLDIVMGKIRKKGWRVVNLDCTIVAETPKLKSYLPIMQKKICEIIGLALANCNIKATTAEGLGFIGRREGIMAAAICSLLQER